MLVLYLAALVASVVSQTSSSCSFEDASGYSLKWSTQNGQANFNLTYRNFQPNTYTGVAFGDNAAFGLDAILVTVVGSQVQVNGATINGQNPPTPQNDRSVTTQSASYRDRVLSAQFSRPIALTTNNHKSLSGCNTWNFYTNPGTYNNGQYSTQNTPRQMKVCNIEQICQGSANGGLNLMSPSRNEIGTQNQMYTNGGYNNNGNQGYNNQGFNGQQGNNPGYNAQYQPQNGPQGQGVNFGYVPNTATIPPRQQYTGTPFVYTTTMDPTYGNSNNFNNQRMNNPSNNGYNSNNVVTSNANAGYPGYYGQNGQSGQNYNTGSGTVPNNTRLFDPYNGSQNGFNVGQGAQANQRMYDANQYQAGQQGPYQGYYSSASNQRMFDPSANQYQQPNYNAGQGPFNPTATQYNPSSSNQRMYDPNANQYSATSNQNQRMQFNPTPNYQNQMYDQNSFNAGYQSQQLPQQYQPSMSYGYQPSQQQQYGYGRKRRSLRVKRQSAGYQPTNNIYGYNYDSNSQGGSGSTLVMNPNYKYLSGPLADEYSRTYSQEVRMYDQQGGTSGGASSMNLNGNAPILNNNQQNQANYQQIQQDYARNPNPNAGQTYTNNIYGYNYASSGGSASGYSSTASSVYSGSSASTSTNRQYDPSNNNLFYPSNPYSTTAAPPVRQFDPSVSNNNGIYTSGSNLKETTLRNPTQYQQFYSPTGVARDSVPGTSPNIPFEYTYFDSQTGLFYPYRTTTNWQPYNSTYYDTNGVVSSYNNQGSSSSNSVGSSGAGNGVMYDSTTGRMRDGSDACALQDPYWCDYYVKIFLSSQEQYNFSTQPMACQALISSLQDSYNGCCNTVRSAGCRA